MPFTDFVAAFQFEPFPRFVAQLEVILNEEQETRLLAHFSLDAARVTTGPARPDLLEVLPPLNEGGKTRLRIWDFKASQKARHEHFVQVAYYSFILDHAVKEVGLKVPLVVRLEGTNVEQGKKIINESGLNVIAANDLSDGAEKIVKAVRGNA